MASPSDPRVAVVTGAARGIGAATVRALIERGWSVVAVDREDDDPRLPYALGRAADVAGVVADVTDPEALGAAVAFAEERFGGLDAMVAAAGGIARGGAALEGPAPPEGGGRRRGPGGGGEGGAGAAAPPPARPAAPG